MRKKLLLALAASTMIAVAAVAAVALTGNGSGGATDVPPVEQGGAILQSGGEDGERDIAPGDPSALPEGAPDANFSLDEAYGAGDGASGGAAGGTGTGGEIAPPLPSLADRKLVRDATISLSVEDVAASVQQVETIATGAGGFVSSSSVFASDPGRPAPDGEEPPRTENATITIRVPADAFASVMSQLRKMGAEVRSESSNTSDVTEEFTDLEARLRNLEATEAQYLELLGRAEEIPDILTLQDRINAVRLEIERIQGRMNVLNDLSDLGTIIVQLQPPLATVEGPTNPGWAEEAWNDAWDASEEVLQALGSAGIVAAVVLAWAAVPALALGIAWRLFGRRPTGGTTGDGSTA